MNRPWLEYLIPHVPRADLPGMLGATLVGAVLAAIYGIVHDQLTYTLSPEYFTRFKFHQFAYADFGWPDRWFVVLIGALATWWVGGIAAWFLARRAMPGRPCGEAYRLIARGFLWIFAYAVMFGVGGYGYGLWRGAEGDYSAWSLMIRAYGIADTWAFVRVAYVHNAGYAGALVGLIAAVVNIGPRARSS